MPNLGARSTMNLQVTINGKQHDLDVDGKMPILWVLRDVLGLTGTKYGCGQALCGACTVHLDGVVVRSCCTPVERAAGKAITTIEGLSADGRHPLQEAWVELAVPQCGFCQAGQLMTAAALLAKHPRPTTEQIDQSMAGNICRCGTYTRIRAAIQHAAGQSPSVERAAAPGATQEGTAPPTNPSRPHPGPQRGTHARQGESS